MDPHNLDLFFSFKQRECRSDSTASAIKTECRGLFSAEVLEKFPSTFFRCLPVWVWFLPEGFDGVRPQSAILNPSGVFGALFHVSQMS